MTLSDHARGAAEALVARLPPRFLTMLVRAARPRLSSNARGGLGVLEVGWSLANAAANGLDPAAILDIGACRGEWSTEARRLFPSARILMVEANDAHAGTLHRVAAALGNAERTIGLLGPERRKDAVFYRMGDGSSVLPERTNFAREPLHLPMRTLDEVAADLPAPILLKLDVQGYELAVLSGGADTLARTEAVLLEVALLPYNEGAPLFAEVVASMSCRGFAVYDVCATCRRISDAALFQMDVLFVRSESPLRRDRPFVF